MVVALERLYDFITGDEDARVCKDIPESACRHQPRNFFAYLVANLLNKVADELASAKLVLPWLLGVLGAPIYLTGLLVPIREAGVLLPQLVVAAAVRHLPRRKGVWLLGGVLSAIALAAMAAVSMGLSGGLAGWVIVCLLLVFSLARGLNSVSAKDVLGKTVSKTRRGALMGWSAGLGGLVVLGIGAALGTVNPTRTDLSALSGLLALAALLWLLAVAVFATIVEEAGATEGGGNALEVALKSLGLLRSDASFRAYVLARLLLLAVALAPPFYVLLAQGSAGDSLAGLGWLIVATGLGASMSSPLWGWLGDRSSRSVMAMAAAGHAVLAFGVAGAVLAGMPITASDWFWAATIALLTVLHSGVRLGRKVYLVDMASSENRAAYVAVSNTVIGLGMLAVGLALGALGSLLGAAALVLLLGLISLAAALYARALRDVSG